MKLRALKSFLTMDRKRGVQVSRKVGEEFEMDETDQAEAEDIYGMLSFHAVVIDEKFISQSGKYLVLHNGVSYTTTDGFKRSPSPGAEIVLDQQNASILMGRGFVRPIDPDAWSPKKLLWLVIKETAPKKMYDSPERENRSWAMKGRE